MSRPRARRRACRPGLAFAVGLLAALAGQAQTPPAPARLTVHLPPGYEFTPSILDEHESLAAFFKLYGERLATPGPESRYGLALTSLTIGLLDEDPGQIIVARTLFAAHAELAKDRREAELARLGVAYTDQLLSGRLPTAPPATDAPVPVVIARLPPPKDFRTIVLGTSAIHVTKRTRIKTQVDRVTRDWLTGVNVKGAPGALTRADLVPFHEGQKAAELMDLTGATVTPVFGTRVCRFGTQWYAPDAAGVYRFELSEDKVVNFPTTLPLDDRHAVLNDTHGLSAIAWDCGDADLAIGCGDHHGKVEAAYYLAERGVDVYLPTDRFLGLLIGANTKGTVIGSAPIKKTAAGAVIGDQPVTIAVDETIVVSTTKGRYPLQYYDTPWRYFTDLARYCGRELKLVPVEVTEYGNATPVVDRAVALGAKVIGIRVKSTREHDAVAAWLRADQGRRAILFHSAVYPDGYRLFREFPAQTSFGDVRPVFR